MSSGKEFPRFEAVFNECGEFEYTTSPYHRPPMPSSYKIIEYLSLKEHSAILAEKDAEIARLLELLDLNSKCLTNAAQEIGAVVNDIDEDVFENWVEGRESLKSIYHRLKCAANNAKQALSGDAGRNDG